MSLNPSLWESREKETVLMDVWYCLNYMRRVNLWRNFKGIVEKNVNFHVNILRGLRFSDFQGVRINYQFAKAKIFHGKSYSNHNPVGVKFMKLILSWLKLNKKHWGFFPFFGILRIFRYLTLLFCQNCEQYLRSPCTSDLTREGVKCSGS